MLLLYRNYRNSDSGSRLHLPNGGNNSGKKLVSGDSVNGKDKFYDERTGIDNLKGKFCI